ASERLLAVYLHTFLPFVAASGWRKAGLLFVRDIWQAAARRMARDHCAERASHVIRVGEPVFRRIGGFLHPAGVRGRHPGCEAILTEKFETHEHDVLVIGAGGAGLRAAIE